MFYSPGCLEVVPLLALYPFFLYPSPCVSRCSGDRASLLLAQVHCMPRCLYTCLSALLFACVYTCITYLPFNSYSPSFKWMNSCKYGLCVRITGEYGPAHMGLEDMAIFRALPSATIFYPSDGVSTEKAVELAANTKVSDICSVINRDQPMLIFTYRCTNNYTRNIGHQRLETPSCGCIHGIC